LKVSSGSLGFACSITNFGKLTSALLARAGCDQIGENALQPENVVRRLVDTISAQQRGFDDHPSKAGQGVLSLVLY
jgi:hypothetical protein